MRVPAFGRPYLTPPGAGQVTGSPDFTDEFEIGKLYGEKEGRACKDAGNGDIRKMPEHQRGRNARVVQTPQPESLILECQVDQLFHGRIGPRTRKRMDLAALRHN